MTPKPTADIARFTNPILSTSSTCQTTATTTRLTVCGMKNKLRKNPFARERL